MAHFCAFGCHGSISEKSAASAKYLKNPRYRIVLVNDLLQIGFSPALLSSSISGSSFDLNNYSFAQLLTWSRQIGIPGFAKILNLYRFIWFRKATRFS
jgi:hypothetical protein